MKKTYEKPIIEITTFDSEDAITTSSFGQRLPGFIDEDFPML